MEEIKKTLNFIVEVEKLKDVHRKTRPVGLDRFENSAEHSWHVCLIALMLRKFSNEEINVDRVIKMLLIHDLGEIDTGDSIIYESETRELKSKEAAGVERILSMLPNGMGKEFMELWHEFESDETPDSRFAKAVDRIPPLLHNIHGGGHSWKEHGITKDQVFSLNQRIAKGSEEVWSVMRNMLEGAVSEGIL